MTRISLSILNILMILIFVGWLSLWALKPTEFWTKKWKNAEEKATSSLFGYNGLDFAVYTFPIIALAIIGFIYSELKRRERRKNRQGRNAFTSFTSPIFVNRYIGILSGAQIFASSLFIVFLVWTFYARVSNDFKKMTPIKSFKLSLWQYKLFRMATRCGLLSEACLALLLLPVLRGMSVFRLLGIQFEASVRYHIWLGTLMMSFATLHGAGTFFIWGINHRIQEEMWKWQKKGRIYLAGEMALVTGLIIWITALPQIRRKCVTSSSSIDENTISIIVKSEGQWTNSLYNHILADQDSEADQRKCIPVAIEGPYGPASLEFVRHDNLLLVAGGIGITPFLSILRELSSNLSNSRNGYPDRIQLIYTIKKSQEICLLDPILPRLLNIEQFRIKLKVYVTRENQIGVTLKEVLNDIPEIQTTYFSTACTNYAIYGSENLLWIAVITMFSSIVFLLSLVCFNSFVIPPAKKPSGQKSSSSQIDLLLICSFAIAIVISTFLAIMIRWKRLKKEFKIFSDKAVKLSSVEGSRDLDEHEIHFGGRPNFQELFSNFSSECGGSDIGVLVCGPEAMKQSVALACRLGKRNAKGNRPYFSFHSLNFTL
ncbi:hypothetical protein DH2020_042716 [Rehmannia glutinosa]|uniref:FAD-binding FR-type domain-containing protein n=1 Tax=Rehmannia glutinosa TaxID=99300 RepID=A0ABR0UMM5_REHGL